VCSSDLALKIGEVKKFTVECINTKNGSEEKYPQDNVVCYHIPARPNFPACKCYVYDHDKLRPEVMRELEKKYAGQEVPRPPQWGGWRLTPETVEFWQGRRSRLHDRLRYRRGKDGGWSVERLAP
jgi:hypothetical protein